MLVDCYFGYGSESGGRQLVKHQLDSFNDFISNKLEQIIHGFNPIDINNTFMHDRHCYKYVVSLKMSKPTLTKPMVTEKDGSSKVMLPNDARLRNLTYSAPIMCDIEVTTKTFLTESGTYAIDTKVLHDVKLGQIPIMVRSDYCMLKHAATQGTPNVYDECRYDHGGYFIVNGNEKVVISQDRISENRIYVFLNTKATCYSHLAEVRSVHESKFGIPKTLLLKLSNKINNFGKAIKICMQYIKQDVPLFVVFRALGIDSDEKIINLIVDPSDPHYRSIVDELKACMDECSHMRTRESACDYLLRHMMFPMHTMAVISHAATPEIEHELRMNALKNMLTKDLLPHTGTDLMKKAVFIASMASKLIRCSLDLEPLDDRDSYINKKLDTPGVLIANLFRQYFSRVIKDTRMLVQKEIKNGAWRATNKLINVVNDHNAYKLVKSSIIESGLKYGLATGNWGAKTNHVRQGVAQVLNRMTYPATMSHLRRINTPMKAGKIIQPRKLHATQWGIICPSETPEGASVGLVKNMALLTTISTAVCTDNVIECVVASDTEFDLGAYSPPSIRNTRVLVNGDAIGCHRNPYALYSRLKSLKKSGTINVFTSIVWSITHNTITICTEGGRFLRPLLVVENGVVLLDKPENTKLRTDVINKKAQWHELVISGIIEYLDVEEFNNTLVAITVDEARQANGIKYTHAELSSFAMMGVLAGSIPFSDHNQAPRNTYQSAMGKQAIGVYASNYRHRFDTIAHVLTYPQKPLVSTHTARLMKCDELPCGQNVIVAFACFTGFNQEDSVICNAAAVKRGLLGTTLFRTFREQNTKNHSTGEEEFFCKPDPLTTRGIKPYDYSKLDTSGFVPEGTQVKGGDVIIGRCMPQKQNQIIVHKDTSFAMKNNDSGVIDRNCYGNRHFTNVTGDGYTFAKVRIRQERIPTIGDKVSCYTGDHQVLTRHHGWLTFPELDIEVHEVACLGRGGNVQYVKPTHCVMFVHTSSRYVQASGYGVDLRVTGEHRMFVSKKFSRSSFEVRLAADLADSGHVCMSTRVAVNTPINDDIICGKMVTMMNAICTIGNMAVDCGSSVVKLPAWFTGLNADCSSILLLNIFSERTGTWIRSRNLLDQLQHIAVNAGYALFVKSEEEQQAWHVRLDVLIEQVMPVTTFHWVDDPDSDRNVYCCTMPEDVCPSGVICVRRNDCVAWCGNSRHGQKGTIGMLFDEEDMPFTASGIVPSIIVNPHAIPSRMTIGQLMEALESKTCALRGDIRDATPFTGRRLEDISDELAELGVEKYGNEVIYNPRTGEQVDCTYFVCPTYYQRLKHMVVDKIHCLTPDHQVLTERGWMFFHELVNEDRVATLQDWTTGGTGTLEYVKPTSRLWFSKHKGKLYETRGAGGVDLAVTSKHRMFVRPRGGEENDPFSLVHAEDMQMDVEYEYKTDALWKAKDLYSVQLPDGSSKDTWDIIRLIAATSAISEDEEDCIRVRVTFAKDNQVLNAITRLGYMYCKTDDATVVHVYDQELHSYVKSFKSRLPGWTWSLSARQAQSLHQLIRDSGNVGRYSAGDLDRLRLHAGVPAESDPNALRGIPVVSTTDYSGPVWCLEVPGEVFYVRRNGSCAWTGNSRAANGPVVLLTRQPAEGRARDGGLRLGEMELECMWAHGSMHFLKERFMECSDNYRIFVCKQCGMMATVNPDENIYACTQCQNVTLFDEIRIPYASKLLIQEIQTMGVASRFITQTA